MILIPSLKRAGCLTIWLLLIGMLRAQPNAYVWGAVFLNAPFHKGWGLHLDAQLRSTEGMGQLRSWLFRPGLQYQVNKKNQLTLGYAYVHSRVKDLGVHAITPEHRLWQQWIHLQPIGSLSLQHRFRIEERFIGSTRYLEGVGTPSTPFYSTRFRYFNRLILPGSKKRPFVSGPYGAVQNEVFLHLTGKDKLNGKTFDQNRFYLALGYRPIRSCDLELGYMRRDLRGSFTTNHLLTWQLAVYLRPQ